MINQRIHTLRKAMQAENIAAVVIPTADPHGSEYIADYWQLRRYFSGFTGSAGTLVVTQNKAGLWTDSRYYLQAENELQNTGIDLFKDGEKDTPVWTDWLCSSLSVQDKTGIDKSLFSVKDYAEIEKKLSAYSIEIINDSLFLQHLRKDKTIFPNAPVFLHDEKFAGQSASAKIAQVKKIMSEKQADCLLLNSPEEIAWLFNIRACDTEYNPVPIAYASIERTQSVLFVKQQKINDSLLPYFREQNISLKDYDEFLSYVQNLDCKIWIDTDRMNALVYKVLLKTAPHHCGLNPQSPKNLHEETSPVERLKAVMNETQIEGIRQAMRKDGVAMIRFLRWLDASTNAATVKIDELMVAEKLRAFRSEQEDFFDESFSTIAGFGAHGAIVHYHASQATNASFTAGNLLLLDSGAQYLHGTTDITRTIFIGKHPNDEQIRNYTLVLKGHIALATAIFPEGTCGFQLDMSARKPLWDAGLNYGHGTGHGVGYFSCVHEGKHNIRPKGSATPLEEGMLLSNEPGFYKTNEYGIRLENLMLVKKAIEKPSFLQFETVTLCPFDHKLIDFSLLNTDEKEWLTRYYETMKSELADFLDEEELIWLKNQISGESV